MLVEELGKCMLGFGIFWVLCFQVNKSVEAECKPVTDIDKEEKYVKLTPTQYQTNIVLKTKKKGKVPITAYYSA